MYCLKCGKQIEGAKHFCPFCGAQVETQGSAAIQGQVVNQPPNEQPGQCPNCGSHNVQIVTEEEGYDAEKGCCGAILLGPIGLLAGLCGAKKKHKRMCVNCGKKF